MTESEYNETIEKASFLASLNITAWLKKIEEKFKALKEACDGY